jgi:hypothetical protein
VLVCACVEHGVGVCGGGEESCHEMAWGGMRGGPCPSIYSHGGGLGGGMSSPYDTGGIRIRMSMRKVMKKMFIGT